MKRNVPSGAGECERIRGSDLIIVNFSHFHLTEADPEKGRQGKLTADVLARS